MILKVCQYVCFRFFFQRPVSSLRTSVNVTKYLVVFCIIPCSHVVSLIPLRLVCVCVRFFVVVVVVFKPVYIHLPIYMRGSADPIRGPQPCRSEAVATCLGWHYSDMS